MTVQLPFTRAAIVATAAAAALAALPVQSASASVALKSDRGSLRVVAEGVPQGRSAKITVARKDWRKKVRSAGTLRNLKPGTYKVWASPIVADGGTAAVPNLPLRVHVPKRRPASLSLRYYWNPKTDPYPPGPVSELAVGEVGPNSVSLRWVNSAAPDSAGVAIRRKAGTIAPVSLEDGTAVTASGSTATDTELSNFTTYSYSVFTLDTAGNVSTPVSVTARTTGQATSIATGTQHSCAVLIDGAVACWGANDFGQLGTGSTESAAEPQLVPITNAVQVVAGGDHTCARLNDQSVWCWGRNDKGQLGDGSLMSSTVPVRAALPSGAPTASLTAGGEHTCAVSVVGALRCWGANGSGQSGARATEVVVPGASTVVTSAVTQVAAGWAHTCYVRVAAVRCFGENADGQLGVDGGVDSWLPVTVAGITKAAKVSAGVAHTCVLLTDRTVQCWGDNAQGQLGDGTTADHFAPQTVSGSFTDVVLGAYHSCALTDGVARCWGRNSVGRLGDGTTTDRPLPTRVALTNSLTQLAAGGYHTCGIAASDTWCWGANALGQSGAPFSVTVGRPTVVSGL